jgi:hypothetical protein
MLDMSMDDGDGIADARIQLPHLVKIRFRVGEPLASPTILTTFCIVAEALNIREDQKDRHKMSFSFGKLSSLL